MVTALSLWLHALAALLFGALTLRALRRGRRGELPRPLPFALGATALWALAVAGIGDRELMTQVTESVRDLAWIAFLYRVHRQTAEGRAQLVLGSVYTVIALVTIAGLGVGIAALTHNASPQAQSIASAALLLRMLTAVAVLVMVQALHGAPGAAASGGLQWLALALGGLWLADFAVFSLAYLAGSWSATLSVLRGGTIVAVALAMAVGLQRKREWRVRVSRTVAYQSLSVAAAGAYLAFIAFVTSTLGSLGGGNARLFQTAFVFGSTTALLTLLSNDWLRAWVKVQLAKHLFRHRYDYRAEWMHFTETLGAPGGAAALDERIVKALADLTASPAGLLLLPDGTGLLPGASWNWDRTMLPITGDPDLEAHLAGTGRIVDLDGVREQGAVSLDWVAVPQWMLDDSSAWVVVPLPHMGQLAGAVLLARPAVPRRLDWEDLDLLKVAGRQVASHLAEARAQEALAEAQRFEEFNRRFAFILHDIKNLVSQLTLTARNAERHADNPAFRADMIATLKDSAERMNGLLARLSQHHRGRADPPQATDVVPLVERVAAMRRASHPITVTAPRSAVALADSAALEQVLGHLLQNAIEASPADAPVSLTVTADGLQVVIEVIDRGCGMSPAFVRHELFRPFASSKPGGFGIGAFEAQQLAQAMQARIDVTSREGEGSRFRVLLKAAHAADLPAERAA